MRRESSEERIYELLVKSFSVHLANQAATLKAAKVTVRRAKAQRCIYACSTHPLYKWSFMRPGSKHAPLNCQTSNDPHQSSRNVLLSSGLSSQMILRCCKQQSAMQCTPRARETPQTITNEKGHVSCQQFNEAWDSQRFIC